MIYFPEILWLSFTYQFIGYLILLLEPVKRSLSREDLQIALLETRGEISEIQAIICQQVVLSFLALIWPIVVYWIAKDSWRAL